MMTAACTPAVSSDLTQANASGCGYRRLGMPASSDANQKAISVRSHDLDDLLGYLGKTKDKAETIRENAPAGSYLDSVLERTIRGIEQEIAQLRYLLVNSEAAAPPTARSGGRMRPAQ